MLAFFALQIPDARAENSFGCDKSWSGPSESNDIAKCVRDFTSVSSHAEYYSVAIILIIFTIIVIVAVPIAFIFNTLCCEDYCFSFTRTTNLARSRCWLWMFINLNLFWSVFSSILIIYGVALLSNSINQSTDYIRGDAISYFVKTKNKIYELLIDYTKNPPVPGPFDLSGFDTMSNTLKSKVDDIHDNYFVYFSVARTASIVIGLVGILLMISCFVIAYCRFNTVGAFSFGILYYIFAIIYSVMAVLLAIITCIMYSFCGEVTLQNRREPGIFQWYFVPWCETQFSFAKARDAISDSTAGISESTCDEILKRCSTTDDDDFQKPFICGKGISTKEECKNIEFALSVLYDTHAKTKFSDMICVNNSNWKYQEVCNIPMCEKSCINYNQPDLRLKDWANDVMELIQFSINRTTALSYVLPIMDCNFVIDKFISTYQTDKGSSKSSSGYGAYCSSMRIACLMLTIGFLVGSIMFVVSIYVTQHGIWMWNDDAEVEDIKEAEAMSKYAKSICSVDQRSQNMSRMRSFTGELRPQGSSGGILANSMRTMSFNQMPQPAYNQS
ncbi:unnamed protein product [Phytomonas sp. Hart1]|nr:unnamed protein product [Phytomonas sp. Hart1]|eukprot:CCW71549.1 unnamed protein product [Phytomonas sp. isolate Hart1]